MVVRVLEQLADVLRLFDDQEQLASAVSAQALALAAPPKAADSIPQEAAPSVDLALEEKDSMEERGSALGERLAEVAASLQQRQRKLSSLLERVSSEARAQRELLATERQSLLASVSASHEACGELSALALELRATQRGIVSRLAAKCTEDMSAPEGDADSGGGLSGRVLDNDGERESNKSGDLVRLNVGGQTFCTTLATLSAEETMLSAMFSGRFDVRTDANGAVFIDRDGTHFRHILNYLRGAGLYLGKDLKLHLALLEEADFYQVEGLQELLRAEVSRLEDKV